MHSLAEVLVNDNRAAVDLQKGLIKFKDDRAKKVGRREGQGE